MNHLIIKILITLTLLPAVTHGQTDSINIYRELAIATSEPEPRLKYAGRLNELSIQAHDTANMMESYNLMAWSYFYLDISKCEDLYAKQFHLANECGDEFQMAKSLYNIGVAKSVSLQHKESTEYFKQALIKFEKAGKMSFVARVYRDIATNCCDIELYASARDNIGQAMKIDQAQNDSTGMGYNFSILGHIYFTEMHGKEHYNSEVDVNALSAIENACDSSMKYLNCKNIEEFDRINILSTYYKHKAHIQIYYAKRSPRSNAKYIEDASENNKKFHEIGLQLQDNDYIISSKIQKAEIEFLKGNIRKAIAITDSLKSELTESWPTHIISTYRASAMYNQSIGNYKQALEDFIMYDKQRQNFMNDKAIMQNAEFRANSQQEVKILEITQKQEEERRISEQKIADQKKTTMLVLIIMVLALIGVIVVAMLLTQNCRNLQKIKDKNARLSQQQQEILTQHDVINEQKNAVERANQIMRQSIRYACHIQHCVLPSSEMIRSIFDDYFIYYQPKDMVSGDFYYAAQHGEWDIFAVADCTGHGVPGGFLSMLGISSLKEIFRNNELCLTPGLMLDMMREYIKQALSNEEAQMQVTLNGEEEQFSTADGMDMSIIMIDRDRTTLQFAGAYQSLFVWHSDQLIRLKGDRMPVGRHINEADQFHTETMQIQKGDMIYMASDGIPSQISGSGVKFMTKRLMDFIRENHNKPCGEQKEAISSIMNEWTKNTIQIDDLTLAGIRVR